MICVECRLADIWNSGVSVDVCDLSELTQYLKRRNSRNSNKVHPLSAWCFLTDNLNKSCISDDNAHISHAYMLTWCKQIRLNPSLWLHLHFSAVRSALAQPKWHFSWYLKQNQSEKNETPLTRAIHLWAFTGVVIHHFTVSVVWFHRKSCWRAHTTVWLKQMNTSLEIILAIPHFHDEWPTSVTWQTMCFLSVCDRTR